jgi:hypothetical protein
MACLIRQLRQKEDYYVNTYLHNGQVKKDVLFAIDSTADSSTSLSVYLDGIDVVSKEVVNRGYLEWCYDNDMILDSETSEFVLYSITEDFEVWHMSEESLCVLAHFANSPRERLFKLNKQSDDT